MSIVKIGDKIPLSVQLHDSRPAMKVRADIFSMYGDQLSSVYLHHIKSGLYINTDVPMPDLSYILVSYTVEDSEEFQSGLERFDSTPKSDEDDWIIGNVDEITSIDNDWITGVVK